jgi:hypothetical protein
MCPHQAQIKVEAIGTMAPGPVMRALAHFKQKLKTSVHVYVECFLCCLGPKRDEVNGGSYTMRNFIICIHPQISLGKSSLGE